MKILGFRFLSQFQQNLVKNFLQLYGKALSNRENSNDSNSYSYILEDNEELIKYIIGDNGIAWKVSYSSEEDKIKSINKTKIKTKYLPLNYQEDVGPKYENRTDEDYINYVNKHIEDLADRINLNQKKDENNLEIVKEISQSPPPPEMIVNINSDSLYILEKEEYERRNKELKEKINEELKEKLEQLSLISTKSYVERHYSIKTLSNNNYNVELDHMPILTTNRIGNNEKIIKKNIQEDLVLILNKSYKKYNNNNPTDFILLKEFLSFLLAVHEVCNTSHNLILAGKDAGWTANKKKIMEKIKNKLGINVDSTNIREKENWELRNNIIMEDAHNNNNLNQDQYEKKLLKKLDKLSRIIQETALEHGFNTNIDRCYIDEKGNEIDFSKIGARSHKIITALSIEKLSNVVNNLNYLK